MLTLPIRLLTCLVTLLFLATVGIAVAEDKPTPQLVVPTVEDKLDKRPFLDRTADFLVRTRERLDALEAKARSETANRKIEAADAVNKTREKLREAEAKYQNLKKATSESAADISSGVKVALDNLSAAYKDAKSRFDQAKKDPEKDSRQ